MSERGAESSSFRFPSRESSSEARALKDFSGVRVLVTGASGFIGSHLVGRLIRAGAEVHAFLRPDSARDRMLEFEGRLQVHEGRVEEYDSVHRCFDAVRPEIVFHLAGDTSARRADGGWEAIARSVEVNLTGTLNVVRSAATCGGVRTLIRTGGLEEYGNAPLPFDEQDRERPVSAYSASQVAATHFCQSMQSQLGFDLVSVRPALVYGPGQSRNFFIPQLIESCLSGTDFEMTGGTQSRDLIHVDDVIDGVMAAASAPDLGGQVINLATGEEHSMNEVAEIILRLTGSGITLRRGARRAGVADLEHLLGSTDHAAQKLGWRARIALEEGLKRTVEWHREQRQPATL